MKPSAHLVALTVLLCIGHTLPLSGQRLRFRPQVHELGLQAVSFNRQPAYGSAQGMIPVYPHGIMYKFHPDLNQAIRARVAFRQAKITDPVQALNFYEHYQARMRGLWLAAGYERTLNTGRYQLYGGAELWLGGSRLDESISPEQGAAGATRRLMQLQYGGAALAGVRVYLNTYVSLSLEANYYYLFQREPEPDANFPFRLQSGSEQGWQLLNAGISLHSKRMRKSCTCGKPGS